MFGPHTLAIEAARVNKWNDAVDHLNFSFNSEHVHVPEGQGTWTSFRVEIF